MKTKHSNLTKILIVGAMDTELNPLLKFLHITKNQKLLDIFPLYIAEYQSIKLSIIKTYVGDVNASVAGFAAIQEINPDYVIKLGAVGGSYLASKAGDIIIPIGFFHRTSWITKRKSEQKPLDIASEWQSIFGNLSYQVNRENLGGIPYYFPVDKEIIKISEKILDLKKCKYTTAYVGGGNMWMFDQNVLNHVANCMLPEKTSHRRFVSDMESYSLAHACYLLHKPFTGCYVVASNDYLNEEYHPQLVSTQIQQMIPYVLDLSLNLAKIRQE
jgi:nucleoside phosphorylase